MQEEVSSLSSDSAPDEMPESVAQIMDGVEGRRAASLLGRGVGPERGSCCRCDLSL